MPDDDAPLRSGAASQADLLQIKDLVAGSGGEAKPDDWVSIDYTAWVYQNGAQGAKLGSTETSGVPETIALDAGANWPRGKMAQGITGMRVGGKRKLFVPAHLGYGERAVNGIPPDSDLYFEIELLEVRTRDE